jgi:hypothetical protein
VQSVPAQRAPNTDLYVGKFCMYVQYKDQQERIREQHVRTHLLAGPHVELILSLHVTTYTVHEVFAVASVRRCGED